MTAATKRLVIMRCQECKDRIGKRPADTERAWCDHCGRTVAVERVSR
jgi:hypothetical protein